MHILKSETKMAELRLDNGLKQKDIAEILKVKTYIYSQWERNINDIPIEVFNTLANFYNVNLDYLLGLSNKSTQTDYKNINRSIICQRLYDLRKEYNLTQEKVGLEVGFPQRTYANYENGTSVPTTFKIYYIALFYNVSVDYLTGRTNDRKIK